MNLAGPETALENNVRERASAMARVSAFAAQWLRRNPQLSSWLTDAALADQRLPSQRWPHAQWPLDDDAAAQQALRVFRKNEGWRLIALDCLGIHTVAETLSHASDLAECCIERALQQIEPGFQQRFGIPRDERGEVQRLVVLGMGKLGGGELNFSSDIDLIFAYPQAGTCHGARALSHEDFFVRLGQRLVQVLDEVTAEGQCYRVDMRLRPFGRDGRLALSFAAMEHYYQREGRDWERYAWIKARPVAGDRAAGERLMQQLRPFVYRRYFDYGAIAGVRDLWRRIQQEGTRQRAQHLKLGPGGIRALEFTVQMIQLMRGGREPALRTPSFLQALDAIERARHLGADLARTLRAAYLFLRHVENRLQMRDDAQVHELPEDAAARDELARGLGYAGWSCLEQVLQRHQHAVHEAFTQQLGLGAEPPLAEGPASAWSAVWLGFSLERPDLPPPFHADAAQAVHRFLQHPAVRAIPAPARAHLDTVMPFFLAQCAREKQPDLVLRRLLGLLQTVAGRSTYLNLLGELPGARQRVAEVFARSAWLAERVTLHPLLLDELLDARMAQAPPGDDVIARELRCITPEEGVDIALLALEEAQQNVCFRLALGWLLKRIDAPALSAGLAALAQAIVDRVTHWAAAEMRRGAGVPGTDPVTGLAVLAYGGLGACELGLASDLDLVFVYDAGGAGPEAGQYYARLAQRIVRWLSSTPRQRPLYGIDTRLRPDGSKGFLVTSLDAFADYQRTRAWNWEHLALVRARWVAGDPRLQSALQAVRTAVLVQPRDAREVVRQSGEMRARWRRQVDCSDGTQFDVKQGMGGLVDLEFALQTMVLLHAASHPQLAHDTRTPALIARLAETGHIPTAWSEDLLKAHQGLWACRHESALNLVPAMALRLRCAPWIETITRFMRHVGLEAVHPEENS